MAYPGTVGPNGITIPSLQDLIDYLSAGYQATYGPGLDLGPQTADGQQIILLAQAMLDTYQQLLQIGTSMDPDQAAGVLLDERCAYNGVQRMAGTYTQQLVSITNSASVTLTGLDVSELFPFTVADGNGNQYQLVTTTSLPSAGTSSLLFEASLLGPVQSAANTITVPVTILPGVTSVNNPSGPTTIGVNEESDPSLRIRRQNSVSLPSKGYLQGLYGALLDIDGVSYAQVYENTGSTTDANGIPSHSIWCLVDITASDVGTVEAQVANAIYVKRNAGCGLKGAITVPILQVDGSTFDVEFDRSTLQNLWVKATVVPITGTIDTGYIAQQVLAEFGGSYGIGQRADSSSIVAYIKQIAPNGSVSAEGVSTDGSTYGTLVSPSSIANQFHIAGSGFITVSA